MSPVKPRILVATKNSGKLAEFRRLLGDSYDIDGLDGVDLDLQIEGTESYQTNANEKASYVAARTGRVTLGDDSGIEALALGGRPGIVSARFAGEPVSDNRNIEQLLAELGQDQAGNRSAQFVCWLGLADEDGLIASTEGVCAGTIGFETRGSNGFGYDPIFVFSDGRTMAELSDSDKDAVSHRGNAVRAMTPHIERALRDRSGNA